LTKVNIKKENPFQPTMLTGLSLTTANAARPWICHVVCSSHSFCHWPKKNNVKVRQSKLFTFSHPISRTLPNRQC